MLVSSVCQGPLVYSELSPTNPKTSWRDVFRKCYSSLGAKSRWQAVTHPDWGQETQMPRDSSGGKE